MNILFRAGRSIPNKALSLSHLKGLLWADVLYRATSEVHRVSLCRNQRVFDSAQQVLNFWAYIDAHHRTSDFRSWTESDISNAYVQMHTTQFTITAVERAAYRERVEHDCWEHPVSTRLRSIWASQAKRLGLRFSPNPSDDLDCISIGAVVQKLKNANACLDMRADGGPLYLDFTDEGIPLRQLISTDGESNYVMCALRAILSEYGSESHADRVDLVVLGYDREASADYLCIERLLGRLGIATKRLEMHRVPIEGKTLSARFGFREHYSVDALFDRMNAFADDESIRLGLRLYFVAHLGRVSSENFEETKLVSFIQRAQRILNDDVSNSTSESVAESVETLKSLSKKTGYVDPYRATSSLFDRGQRGQRIRSLATEIFL
ncbi:MAG: hypothetical protein R3A47_05505 [Polyangiales bacterium]